MSVDVDLAWSGRGDYSLAGSGTGIESIGSRNGEASGARGFRGVVLYSVRRYIT